MDQSNFKQLHELMYVSRKEARLVTFTTAVARTYTQVKQTMDQQMKEKPLSFIATFCLGKDEEKGRNNPPKRIRGSNFIVHGDYIEAKSSMVNTGDGTQVGNQTPGRFSNSQMNIHGAISTENIEEQDPYEEPTTTLTNS